MNFLNKPLSLTIVFFGTIFSMSQQIELNYRQAGLAHGMRFLTENLPMADLFLAQFNDPSMVTIGHILFHQNNSSAQYRAAFEAYKLYWSGMQDALNQYEVRANDQRNADVAQLREFSQTVVMAPDMETVQLSALNAQFSRLREAQSRANLTSTNTQNIFTLDTNSPEYQEGYSLGRFAIEKMIQEVRGAAPLLEERIRCEQRLQSFQANMLERHNGNERALKNAAWNFMSAQHQAFVEFNVGAVIATSPNLSNEAANQFRTGINLTVQMYQSTLNAMQNTPNAWENLQNATIQAAHDIDLPMYNSQQEE